MHGHLHDSASAPYDVLAARTGWAETPTEQWWDAIVTACLKLPSTSRERCAGIGLSGQMHGLVLSDQHGRALRPAILHADTRASDQLDRYRHLPQHALARLANPLSPNMAGPMLLWLAQHEPSVLAQARWALQPKDWIRRQLTEQVAAEPSDASATLLYDVAGQRWDEEVVDGLGIRGELLAPLLSSSSAIAGHLVASAAARLGLPAGIPVAAGGGDTAVAALGSGQLEHKATQLTIGTGGQIITALSRSDVGEVADWTTLSGRPLTTHTYRDAAEGYYAMAAVLNAGLALDWVRRALSATWQELYASAEQPIGHDAPLFVPHLTGERTPHLDPTLRATWSGLELSHTRTDMLKAALEGVAFNLRDALEVLPGQSSDQALRVAGGGTQSHPWRQLLADVLQRPLQVLSISGASSRGAAILGALASKAVTHQQVASSWSPELGPVVQPRPSLGDQVQARRCSYQRAVQALRTP